GRPVGLVVLALLLVAGGWYGWRVWQHNQPVHVPATLAGLPQSSDPLIATTAAQIQKSVQADNPGIKLEVKAYSNGGDRVLFAGAARGQSDVSKDFAEVGSQVGPSQSVGSATCSTGTRVAVTLCERSEGDLTVLAMSVRRTDAADTVQQVAALVDVVWSQICRGDVRRTSRGAPASAPRAGPAWGSRARARPH